MVPVETYLEYLENTSMPNLSEAFRDDVIEMHAVLDRLYSKSSPHGSDRQRDAFLCACEPLVAEFDRLGGLPGEVFAVTVEQFMDRDMFDVERVARAASKRRCPTGASCRSAPTTRCTASPLAIVPSPASRPAPANPSRPARPRAT